jgi:signal transduction histidine kinase/DNA-binding NarL/FixJ family response regulator
MESETVILLVEDNEQHAELVQRALEDTPALRVNVARRLDEARASLRQASPDLVIADLRLPDGEGIELCAEGYGVPVVVMTSQGSEADAVAAMRTGALDYVVKSESMFEEMPHIVERALREWRLAMARERADRSLHAQFDVASALATSSTLGEAGPRILEAICRCAGWPMGEFWRVDDDAHVLRREVAWTSEPALAPVCEAVFAPLASGVGLPGATWAAGVPTSADTLQGNAAFPSPELCGGYGVPVRTAAGPFGVFAFYSRTAALPGLRGCEIEPLMTAVSHQLALFAERQRAEEDRERLQRELLTHERLAAIGETAAALAHEIANPLNSMFVLAQLLQRRVRRIEGIDPKIPGDIDKLLEENRRLAGLLQEFRSQRGGQELDRARIDLAALCEHVIDMHRPFLRSQGIAVETEIGAVPHTIADAHKLTQVLVNLIKNGAEAMPAGGTLSLRLFAEGDELVVEIADSGTGIAAGLDVFAPFLTTKATGTGLGLPVAQQIVTAHGGTIGFTSDPGGGTTFRIRLPHRR